MASKPIEWQTVKRKLSDLKPMEGNPRQATGKQVEDLTKSLKTFNLAAPIIINTDNTIIGGHFRYNILIKNKNKNQEIDTRIPSRRLSETEAKELNLRLNKNLGDWDWDLLSNFGDNLLEDVGFNVDHLKGLDFKEILKGMPEFEQEGLEYYKKLVVRFKTEGDYKDFKEAIGNKDMTENTRAIWYPDTDLDSLARDKVIRIEKNERQS